MYRYFLKRFFDIILSFLAIILLSPLLIIVSILVRIKLGSPIIFKQQRPGKNEKIFTLYKFRSMTNKKDKEGNLLPDSDRLTKFGKFLRSTSLDELPELFNILIGQMSFIGPRPQLIKDLVFMDDIQRKRHDVRPGLTGLAQINGRNNISWEEKFYWDIEYINDITLLNDIKIFILTLYKVLKRSDINSNGFITTEDYGDYLLRNNKVSQQEYNELIEKSKKLYKGN